MTVSFASSFSSGVASAIVLILFYNRKKTIGRGEHALFIKNEGYYIPSFIISSKE